MTLTEDFPTKREFNCYEFVRLRALYLPNVSDQIYDDKEEKQLALMSAMLLKGQIITVCPTRYFNCLKIPSFFISAKLIAMRCPFEPSLLPLDLFALFD